MKRVLKSVVQSGLSKVAPLRWRLTSEPSLLVVMYHRVLPPEDPSRAVEQPGMFVSPATLDMHLRVLREHFELVHLDDWLRREGAGDPLPARACALTFDDGWRDNYEHAFPVLERHQAPATIFLVSTLIGTNTEFWPNRLARILASPTSRHRLPAELAALLAPVLDHAQERLRPEDLDRAILLAKQLSESTIHRLLEEAERGGADSDGVRTVLNEDELRTMARSGLVRYGSHTRTHFRCREGAAPEVLEREIGDSRAEIASVTAQPVEVFCYPNGDTTPAAVDVVSRHYAAAVTTQKGWYRPGSNRFLIPRVGVHEDISNRPDAFIARLSGWL